MKKVINNFIIAKNFQENNITSIAFANYNEAEKYIEVPI